MKRKRIEELSSSSDEDIEGEEETIEDSNNSVSEEDFPLLNGADQRGGSGDVTITTNAVNFFTSPARSVLARERVTSTSTKQAGKKTLKKPKRKLRKKYSLQRIAEFPNDTLVIEAGELFCRCCSKAVSNLKHATDTHVKSQAHVSALTAFKSKEASKQTVVEYFERLRTNDETYRGRDRLSETVVVDRVMLTSVLMTSGIPLSKLEDKVSNLKSLLEIACGNISVSHLRELIPHIRNAERARIMDELKTCGAISLIFDGTTDVCEVAVLRWCDDKFRPQQRLLTSAFLDRSMNGETMSGFLAQVVLTDYSVAPIRVHAMVRDGAAVKGVATRNMQGICVRAIDIICSSHTACLSGKELGNQTLPLATNFISRWNQMMSTSNIARQEWKAMLGRRAKTKSMVRWGSEYDVVRDVLINFGSVVDLITRNDIAFADNLRQAMRASIAALPLDEDGLSPRDALRLQLALYHDVGLHIYNFVYDYEGDGFLSPFVYDRMDAVIKSLNDIVAHNISCPNVNAVVRDIVPDAANVQRRTQLLAVTCGRGAEARAKFISKFVHADGSCFQMMQVYKTLALLRPAVLLMLGNDEINLRINSMCQLIPFFRSIVNFANCLRDEIPLYRNRAAVNPCEDNDPALLSAWWFNNRGYLPNWSIVAAEAVLYTPSSAGAERVFAMIRCLFHDEQEAALEDYKEASIMLRYNTLWRNKYL